MSHETGPRDARRRGAPAAAPRSCSSSPSASRSHGADCPEWVCVQCGDAVLVGFGPLSGRPAARRRRARSPDRVPAGRAGRGPATSDEPPRYVRIGNALLAIAEDVIYVGIAVLLAVSAGVLLVSAASGPDRRSATPAASEVGARGPGPAAAGLHRGRAAVRGPGDPRQARGRCRAVPRRRHHRLDQGDHRALGRGRRLRRQGRQVQRRHHRGGRPGRARAGARRLGDPAARSRSASPRRATSGPVARAARTARRSRSARATEGAAGA